MKIQAAFASLCLVALVLQPGQRAFAQEAGAAPLQTIAALDVPRYMGTWYEIAKSPTGFRRNASVTRALSTARKRMVGWR